MVGVIQGMTFSLGGWEGNIDLLFVPLMTLNLFLVWTS